MIVSNYVVFSATCLWLRLACDCDVNRWVQTVACTSSYLTRSMPSARQEDPLLAAPQFMTRSSISCCRRSTASTSLTTYLSLVCLAISVFASLHCYTTSPCCFCLQCHDTVFGCQEEHLAYKNCVMRYWCGYLYGARCKWFAYGPADATATPSSSGHSWKILHSVLSCRLI